MGPVSTSRPARQHYFPVNLVTLRVDRLLNFDLHICLDGQVILYREKSLPFSEECRRRLLESRVREIYIDESQRRQFLAYMESELPLLLNDEKIEPQAKASIMYATSKVTVEDIFENPTFGENIKRSEKLVEQTVQYLTGGEGVFRSLARLSDQNYRLYSHSVNVCTFALGLAREVGVTDPGELQALGVGAMLHDIGKTRIDGRVMRKRTPLSHEEFGLMKKHVELGVEILRESNVIPGAAFIPVIQHQEREDGSGYPKGLKGDQIHVFGKITGIADIFDAMTSERVFRRALSPYEAVKAMLAMPLDRGLLRAFIRLLGPR